MTGGDHADRVWHTQWDAKVLREVVERTERQDPERRIRVRERRGHRANRAVPTSGHDQPYPSRHRATGQRGQGVTTPNRDRDVQASRGERVLHLRQRRMLVVARAASSASGRVQQDAHGFRHPGRLSVCLDRKGTHGVMPSMTGAKSRQSALRPKRPGRISEPSARGQTRLQAVDWSPQPVYPVTIRFAFSGGVLPARSQHEARP